MTVEDQTPAEPRKKRSVARNAAALLASQSLTWILATAIAAIVPRFLGPTAQGQFRLAAALWAMIEILAAVGTARVLQIELAREPSIARDLTNRVIRLRALTWLVLLPPVAIFLWIAEYGRTTVIIMALAGVATVMSLVSSTYRASLYGLREMGKTGRIDVIVKLIVAASTIGILVIGGRVIALSIATAVLAVVGLWLMRASFHSASANDLAPSPLIGRKLLRAGAPFLVADATLVIYQSIDTLVMSFLVAEEAIGWYATADVLFGSLLFIPVILTTALFPALAELQYRDASEVSRMLTRTFRSLLVFAIPVGLATVIVAKPFVDLLYGPRYAETVPVLEVYGVVTIFSFMTILLGSFAFATERTHFWNALMIIATIATIPLDIVLVPWTDRHFENGAIGGALAYIVTESFMLVVGTVVLAKGVLTATTLARVARCLAGGAAMFLVGWPLRDYFFLIPGLASIAAYVLVVVVLRTFDDEERGQFKKMLHGAKSRFMPNRGAAVAG